MTETEAPEKSGEPEEKSNEAAAPTRSRPKTHTHDGCWAIFEAQSGRRYFGNIIRLRGMAAISNARSLEGKDITPDQVRTAISEWSSFTMYLKPVIEFETMPAKHPTTGQMTKIPMISPPGLTTEPVLLTFGRPGAIYFVKEMGETDRSEHEQIVEMAAHMGDRVKEDAEAPRIHHPSEGVPAAAVHPLLRR